MSNIEQKVLLNVLKAISQNSGDEYKIAPDDEYLKSLENIGFIELGWDNKLTELGRKILNNLQSEEWK